MLPVIFFLGGCAKLAHLEQLLTMKAYSDNKDAQEEYVQAQTADFEKLLRHITENKDVMFKTKKELLAAFGPPVYRKKAFRNRQQEEVWLYRPPTAYFKGEKVYFCFGPEDDLLRWDYVADPLRPKMCRVKTKTSKEK